MSIDSVLENITKTVMDMTYRSFSKFPVLFIPVILQVYLYVKNYYNSVKKQMYVTYTAILQSFENEYIFYYKNGSFYIPAIVLNSNLHNFNEKSSWIYSVQSETFYKVDSINTTKESHHLKYLGASLLRSVDSSSAVIVGDLSDWIIDQSVRDTSGDVPLNVFVSAWSYSVSKKLYYTYKDLILVCMDINANEVAYNLETGLEVPIPTIVKEVVKDESDVDSADSDNSDNSAEDTTNDEETNNTKEDIDIDVDAGNDTVADQEDDAVVADTTVDTTADTTADTTVDTTADTSANQEGDTGTEGDDESTKDIKNISTTNKLFTLPTVEKTTFDTSLETIIGDIKYESNSSLKRRINSEILQ
jgi:hypothetical protein